MPSLLTSLTAVERLSAQITTLPAEFSKALGEDLEYARFGAALPELPWFGGWKLSLHAWFGQSEPPHFTRLIRDTAPVAFGLKSAELVSNGALVGVEAGLAFIAGYFTQLIVERELEPIMQRLLVTHRKPNESIVSARNRIEWSQALMLMQDLHGSPLVGTPAVRAKLQIRKESGAKGIGRGLFELMRVSSQDAFGESPSKLQVDGWMRGLYFYSVALGSPLGRLKSLPAGDSATRELYRGPGTDVFAALDRGLEKTREVLTQLGSMIRRNSFSARSKLKFLAVCPEGPAISVVNVPRVVKTPATAP